MLEPAAAPAEAGRIGVLVVDGHPVVRAGVRRFLDGGRVRVVGDAGTAEECVRLAGRMRPDVVLLDPWLPDMLPGAVVERLRAVSPETRIVLFAGQLTPSLRESAARLRVQGLLGKDATAEGLLAAVERVAAGEVLAEMPCAEARRRAAAKLDGVPLTPREHEVLRQAALGRSNAEIAHAINLAPTTVKSYLQSSLRKLGARNRAEAVVKLAELRLL